MWPAIRPWVGQVCVVHEDRLVDLQRHGELNEHAGRDSRERSVLECPDPGHRRAKAGCEGVVPQVHGVAPRCDVIAETRKVRNADEIVSLLSHVCPLPLCPCPGELAGARMRVIVAQFMRVNQYRWPMNDRKY
jgi:hypothetical protein